MSTGEAHASDLQFEFEVDQDNHRGKRQYADAVAVGQWYQLAIADLKSQRRQR